MSGARLSTLRLLFLAGALTNCDRKSADAGGDPAGGTIPTGGEGSGGGASSGGDESGGSGGLLNTTSGPRYHPPEGFEDCVHAPVEKNCSDGWCVLPAGCFVMGSPESEWSRGARTEDRTAVTFSRSIEIQEHEMTRAQWVAATGVQVAPPPDESDPCIDDACPVSNITWWEALESADLLSTSKGLEPCYQASACQNGIGEGRYCEGVADPQKSIYECEGYRLPTRAEAEYAARAGTISTFYSGEIATQTTYDCQLQPNLQAIAWYCHNSGGRLRIVEQKEANDFGLHDMLGNVREWTNDGNRIGPPPGGLDPAGSVNNHVERIVFGGRYNSYGFILRAANISAVSASGRGNSIGFRLVRTLPE